MEFRGTSLLLVAFLASFLLISTVEAQGKKVKIFVQVTDGSSQKRVPLELQLSDTLLTVKSKIEAKENIPARRQLYVFEGQSLEDRRSLADYNVVNGSVLRMTVRAASV